MRDSTTEPSRCTIEHQILVSIQSPSWQREKYGLEKLCQQIFDVVTNKYHQAFEVSIVFTDDAEIQKLNATYRHKNKPTNVLSFPSGLFTHSATPPPSCPIPLGDVVLAFETINRESQEQRKTPHDHLSHLLIHAFLHLLGYDHQTDEEAQSMEELEIQYLRLFNIENPYLLKE